MDRMIHTALNSLKMILQNQQITAQNIANANVVGYRKDSSSEFGTAYLNGEDSLNTRVFATRQIGTFSEAQGNLESTENPFDVAINGEGYFIIQPNAGDIALSRRGDLKIDQNGQLMNGEGSIILGEDLQPIIIPPFKEVEIAGNGAINIRPIEAPVDAPLQFIANIGTTSAAELELEKDDNGFIRPIQNINAEGVAEGQEINPLQDVILMNKYLEKSNVNPVEELILTLEHQRNYETHVKFINLAKEMDEGGASLMRIPS